MHLPSLTDDELLLHVDNLPDASELVRELARELARRMTEMIGAYDAVDALENVGIDVTLTADLETLENALAFHRQRDVQVVEKLIDACADADVYDADDLKRVVDTAERVSLLEEEVDNLHATIDELRQQIADLIA